MRIKQKSVHANGQTVTIVHSKTDKYDKANTYSKGDGYHKNDWGNHSNSSHYSETPCHWNDACGWTGGWHSNTYGQSTGGYSNGGWYSNANAYTNGGTYTNTSTNYTNNTVNINTVNWSPKVSNAILNSANYGGSNTITLNIANIAYADTENNARSAWRIYYHYRTTSTGNWGNWTLVAEVTGTTYSWNISSLSPGYYQVAITVYDGNSWSALLSGNTFITDYRETLIESSSTSKDTTTKTIVTPTTNYDTISYALSQEFTIFRYTPPAWLSNQWKKATMDQIYTEVNKARNVFDLAPYSFSNTPIITNFTFVKASDMEQLVTAANEVATKAGKPTITNAATETTIVSDTTLQRLQNLLDSLAK